MNAARWNLPRWNRSVQVDLDVFFSAAVGARDHDAEADHDRDSDQSPRDADALQNTHFPERGQDAANQDSETDKIHACPFHDGPPRLISDAVEEPGALH